MSSPSATSTARNAVRIAMGAAMVFAGTGHLSFARKAFQAQVPDWVPLDKDTTVLASGVVEIGLGAALAGLPRQQRAIGAFLAAFYVAVFPGNIAQYTGHRDAFGLDTDTKRAVRLAFQPLLVGLAWWSTRNRT